MGPEPHGPAPKVKPGPHPGPVYIRDWGVPGVTGLPWTQNPLSGETLDSSATAPGGSSGVELPKSLTRSRVCGLSCQIHAVSDSEIVVFGVETILASSCCVATAVRAECFVVVSTTDLHGARSRSAVRSVVVVVVVVEKRPRTT